MSWLFSRVLVEEYLGENYSDGEQSAPLSGNPTQLAYLHPDKMTKFSRLSRFGMTFKPLMESRGEELLTLYLEGFHAKTYPQQEREPESTESVQACGNTWRGWLAKYDQATSLWKTPQCSLLEDSEQFSETWPRWGTMRNGECWEQQTLVPHIKETESGLSEKWATPTTMDKLPPKSQQALLKEATQARPGRSKPANLRDQVSNMQNWPTPTSHMAKETNAPSEHNRKTPTLTAQVNWPTPRTKGMCGGSGSWDLLNKNTTVEEARQMGAGNGGKLNPDWVEWLMNWPIKWSNLNEFNPKEFKRWQKESATDLQESVQMRTVWWNKDPSQTSSGQQSDEQQLQQYSNSLSEMSWDDTRKREVERPHEGQNMSLLRENIHIQASEGKNVQQTVREQVGMDEAQIIPRTSENIIARIDRLKAIGNGQVPLCAASAWRILNELATS